MSSVKQVSDTLYGIKKEFLYVPHTNAIYLIFTSEYL